WTVAFPWALDEGIVLFGDILPNNKLSYAGSIQNGNNGFNFDDNANKTVALKLMTKPVPWLYFSSSFLNLGLQGNNANKGRAEFWLSGQEISPINGNFVSGHVWEQDVKLMSDAGELWANFGYFHSIDGGHKFDRYIRYYAT